MIFNAVVQPRYTAVATSFVNVAEGADPAEIFQGSQFVVQRMSSYAPLASSPLVLQPVITKLNLPTSVRDLRKEITVSSPPETVLLEVSATDAVAATSARIADEVSIELGKVIQELETPRGLGASRVKVTLTDPADVPLTPSSPQVLLNLLLGAIAGAAIGFAAALIRHNLDRRINTIDDVRGITGMAPVGSTLASRTARRDPLVAVDFRSADAERYHGIRTALKLASVDQPLHHFVVSSPMPREGKTSVAANLAVSWAQAGARVCLVESDLRRPMIARMMGLESTLGLADVLVGDVELDEVLVPWPHGSVTVLPAGSLPADPASLLGSDAMSALVSELRSRFDVVIYDSPPIASVTDAIVLARAVDGLVLVVRAGSTTRDYLASCVESLRAAHIKLLGTVRFAIKVKRKAKRPVYPLEPNWRTERTDQRTNGGAAKKSAAESPASGEPSVTRSD